jgi:phthalate 3,4-dioxygenase ferredoxin reductase subunit
MTALTSSDSVAIVGAGLAGWRLAEALRRDGFSGTLTLLSDEEHRPYDRPPLSKQVLSAKWPIERCELASDEQLVELNINLLTNTSAQSLDVARHRITVRDGHDVEASHIVIATGARARTLEYSATSGVHTVRSRSDVARLLSDLGSLDAGSDIVIVGGGFIGAEAATSLLSLGHRPVVLEAMARPLMNVVGNDVSLWLEHLASDAGVDLRGSQAVRDVFNQGESLVVEMADGSRISAGLVIVAIGAVPNTEWLDSSGLELRGGVVVDDHLRAVENIWAMGDVARFTWRHDPFVEEVRIEHWQTANDHAQYLAAQFLSNEPSPPPLSMVPYFWSDQYGKKIQMLGHPAPSDDVTCVLGSPDDAKWLALYSRADIVTGLLSLSQPRALMVSRDLVAEHATLENALTRQPWV